MGFADTFIVSLPPGFVLPEPIAALLRWIDDEGLAARYTRTDRPYALLHPEAAYSAIAIEPVDPDHAASWLNTTDREAAARVAPFLRTGGDGSYAALWRDPADVVRIVHMGSGSGSVLAGIWVADPLDLLRLLAIGYPELCWPEDYGETPADIAARDADEEDEDAAAPAPPERLRAWVEQRYGLDIPERAEALVIATGSLNDAVPADPFLAWQRGLPQRA